ncbi:LEA type 2 family protein [Rehaibacterium terrae]|jgi:hypothetical protein|uniref:Late embryogenesis abundant protein LEA-2 subgroup domain-containing protein n=1 Tax=Rehaibacterium terrae TaxID=1341696 RepID=A0A7W7Y095_9GAMM|nr:LEA type 2 family protein [Rehaibacterium terrae]MBB5015702.1 hypothetical protein [Rehaibacterium terrae]
MRRPLLLLAFAALLTACSSDPVKKRVWPPQASLQEVAVQDDGQWRLNLRLQNFSTVAMRYDQVDLRLEVAGIEAGRLSLRPGISVGPGSAEIVEALLTPADAAREPMDAVLRTRNGLRYRLVGRIVSGDPRGNYDIEFASALNPVPGLDGVLR